MRRVVGMLLVALAGFAVGQDVVWHGHWAVSSVQDEFTDEVRGVAFLAPVEQPSVLYTTALAVLCGPEGTDGVLTAVFDHPEFLLGRMTSVTYRVDGKPAREGEWVVGSSYVGPVGALAREFLGELVGGERLILRLRDGGSTLEFRVVGFSDAMRALGCYTGPT